MVGTYGVGEVLARLEKGFAGKPIEKIAGARTELPKPREIANLGGMFLRSSLLGTIIGLIPGAGATVASFVSYGVEAQYGRRKNDMGRGVAEGIVAPQAAATASVGGALVPLLALGIPGKRSHGGDPGRFHAPGHTARTASPRHLGGHRALHGLCLCVDRPRIDVRDRIFRDPFPVRILEFPEAIVSSYVVILCCIGAL